jgi:hypothetical protein
MNGVLFKLEHVCSSQDVSVCCPQIVLTHLRKLIIDLVFAATHLGALKKIPLLKTNRLGSCGNPVIRTVSGEFHHQVILGPWPFRTSLAS